MAAPRDKSYWKRYHEAHCGRKRTGLCVDCGTGVGPAAIRCPDCRRAYRRRYEAAARRGEKPEGYELGKSLIIQPHEYTKPCLTCGAPIAKGQFRCPGCREAALDKRRWRRVRGNPNRCQLCGKWLTGGRRQACAECSAEWKRIYWRRKYMEKNGLKRSGNCVACGAEIDRRGLRCEPCKRARKKAYDKARNQGCKLEDFQVGHTYIVPPTIEMPKCRSCGKSCASVHARWCPPCREKRIAAQRAEKNLRRKHGVDRKPCPMCNGKMRYGARTCTGCRRECDRMLRAENPKRRGRPPKALNVAQRVRLRDRRTQQFVAGIHDDLHVSLEEVEARKAEVRAEMLAATMPKPKAEPQLTGRAAIMARLMDEIERDARTREESWDD